jgi:hypothetical protein
MHPAVSLEDIRRNRYLTVAEFAGQVLRVSPSTYYRALQGRAEIPTMRQIAQALELEPGAIAEFVPPASEHLLRAITEGIDEAERTGWIELDPQTFQPTGRRVREPFPSDDMPESMP